MDRAFYFEKARRRGGKGAPQGGKALWGEEEQRNEGAFADRRKRGIWSLRQGGPLQGGSALWGEEEQRNEGAFADRRKRGI